MPSRIALKIIFAIGLAGLAFSGYLSYNELFATCTVGCPIVQAPGPFGLPACVYGFFMYLAVAMIAALGLRKK
jgi:hypothetical protein